MTHPADGDGHKHREGSAPSLLLGQDTGPSNRLETVNNLGATITELKADGFAFTTVSVLCGLR
jgi:hypothetical protein